MNVFAPKYGKAAPPRKPGAGQRECLFIYKGGA